jgi:hypothetical protein
MSEQTKLNQLDFGWKWQWLDVSIHLRAHLLLTVTIFHSQVVDGDETNFKFSQ